MKPRESLAMLQIILEEQEYAYLQSVWSDIRLSRMTSERKSVPLWFSTIILLTFIITCSLVWQIMTKWPIITCVYFAFCTFTTVGFGDINPTDHHDADDLTRSDNSSESDFGEEKKILLEVVQFLMI